MTPEQEQAIVDLRSRHVAPKQIARQLGLRPAEVSAFLKAQAEQATNLRKASGELHPIFQCLVNKSCLPTLTNTPLPPAAETAEEIAVETDNMDPSNGFAIVTVSRQAGFNRIEIGTYLVDLWCLGVKDAVELRTVDPTRYRDFVDYAYAKFPDGYTEVSLEMAQAIVFGAEQYAAKLGFQPHRDFAQTRSHLGTWSGEPQLHFGRNGKPFYMSGPYDNSAKIFKTLQETVGEGNFDYVISNSDPW